MAYTVCVEILRTIILCMASPLIALLPVMEIMNRYVEVLGQHQSILQVSVQH